MGTDRPVPATADAPSETSAEPRPSVAVRMTALLDLFLDGPECLLLEDLAAMSGMPRSTTFRQVMQLVDLQWLQHDSPGYRLGVRAESLAARCEDRDTIRYRAAGALSDLHLSTGGVALLGCLEGGRVHYLDKVGGKAFESIPSRVGTRVPADTTILGRAMLAALPPERVDHLVSMLEHTRLGPPCDRELLHRRLQTIRARRGLALMHVGDSSYRIAGAATAILGPDGVVGGFSVAARGEQLTPELFAPRVLAASRRVTQQMFPGWSALAV